MGLAYDFPLEGVEDKGKEQVADRQSCVALRRVGLI